jgi:threonine/homoserine/homoserine lactone efflux protein
MTVFFLLVSIISTGFYTTFSGYLGSKVKSPRFQNTFNKATGAMLLSAGAVTASVQK